MKKQVKLGSSVAFVGLFLFLFFIIIYSNIRTQIETSTVWTAVFDAFIILSALVIMAGIAELILAHLQPNLTPP